MQRFLLVFSLLAIGSSVIFPSEAFAQRFRRRFAMAPRTTQTQRPHPQATRIYQPPARVYTREGVNEFGEKYYVTTRIEGDWRYHEGVDRQGNSFTGESLDWGGGFESHDLETHDGRRYTGHSFDWGDGYSTYSFEDEEGNEFEFDSHDLELNAEIERW